MASCSADSKVKIWDLRKGKALYTLFGHTGRVNSVEFSFAGDYFASGGDDNSLLLWKSNFYNSQSTESKAIKPRKRKVQDKVLVFPNKAQKEQESKLRSVNVKNKKKVEIKPDKRVNSTLDKILNQLDNIHHTLKVNL